jgi:hypothetical protein
VKVEPRVVRVSLRCRTGATVVARGISQHAAALFLGHTSAAITEGHYIEPDRSIDPTPTMHLERTAASRGAGGRSLGSSDRCGRGRQPGRVRRPGRWGCRLTWHSVQKLGSRPCGRHVMSPIPSPAPRGSGASDAQLHLEESLTFIPHTAETGIALTQ